MKESPSLTSIAFGARLYSIFISHTAQRSLENRLQMQPSPPSAAGYGVLSIIRHQPLTISELSSLMLITPSTLVTVVDSLERRDLAVRNSDRQDKRRNLITIKPAGTALLREVPMLASTDPLLQAIAGLSESERQKLVQLLEKVVQQIVKPETYDYYRLGIQNFKQGKEL